MHRRQFEGLNVCFNCWSIYSASNMQLNEHVFPKKQTHEIFAAAAYTNERHTPVQPYIQTGELIDTFGSLFLFNVRPQPQSIFIMDQIIDPYIQYHSVFSRVSVCPSENSKATIFFYNEVPKSWNFPNYSILRPTSQFLSLNYQLNQMP